ncbi:uncharacterized protein [Antedon mediterranea]|uniref:uncharacterized protein n=1 Tax=Antedon mediterranea TaxID=105859 RepID=UPI003AF7250C
MGALQQLSLLIWKDIRLRIRAPVLTVISVIWPIAVFAAVAIIRSDFPPEQHTNCYYNAKAMPSSGAVDFMQSYMCDLETACIPGNSSTIESNEVPSYTGASISAVFDSLEPLISNENVTESLNGISGSIEPLMELADGLQAGINITNVDYRVGDLFKNESHVAWFLESKIQLEPDVVDAFLNSFINVNELLDITGYVDFYRITCNETELQKYLDFPRGSDVRKISQELCRINITSIPEIIGEFQEQLNIEYLVLQIARFTSAISGNEWYDWVAAIEDALNVLVKLDAFPELQELIRGLGNSYDMLIAVRDGLKLFQDMQSGDIEDDTIKRLFEMMDSLFGDEEWWMNMKSNIEPFLDFLYETEEKRNGTRLEDLYRDGVLEMILDNHFGDVIDVKEGFKNASINFGKLLSLFEDETGWDDLLNVCNDTSSFTELLEFDEMVDVQSIQEALCMNNVTQFWVDLISGMDAILIAKKTKEHLSTLKEGELDWQLILHSLFNLTGMDDLPSFLNVDLEALKYILDDDMTQAFMEIFEILSNTPVEEWFSAETIGYCLSILDGAFSNQTWWNEIKYGLGDGIRLGDTPIDRLLGNNSTFKLLDMYLNHTHFVIDALRDSTLHLQKIMALFSDTANHTDIWMVAHMICQNEIDISDFITFEPSVDEHEFLMEICSINFTMIFDEPNKHEDIMKLIEQIIELSNYSKDDLGLRLIFEDVLSKIDELPQEVFALFYVIQAYQSGDIEMLFDMLIPKDGLSSGNILNGTMTSWLNSTFYQVDQELIHLINAVIVSLNDIHDAFKENVLNVCPEFDAETVTSCDYLCESHVECGTDQICCIHGCGTTCIDEDSPELRKFIDGSFGLLEELSRFHSNGSLSQSQLSMIIMELVSLQYDSFLCNTTAIGTVVGPLAAADLSSHLDTICSVNITALFLEIQKEINMEQIESLIGIIFFGMPPPYEEERVSFEEFVQNIEKLAGNVLNAPEIFQELDGRYNITVEDLLNLLSVFSMQMDFDPMDMME